MVSFLILFWFFDCWLWKSESQLGVNLWKSCTDITLFTYTGLHRTWKGRYNKFWSFYMEPIGNYLLFSDVCKDFLEIPFSVGVLGAKAPRKSKGYNCDLRKIIFSFKYVWVSWLAIIYEERISAHNYILKVNYRNTRTRWIGVVLVSLLLNLNMFHTLF